MQGGCREDISGVGGVCGVDCGAGGGEGGGVWVGVVVGVGWVRGVFGV